MFNTESGFNAEGGQVAPSVPIGDITIGTIVVSETTASVPFSYDNTDQTGYEYQLDDGTITSTSSPINLTNLTEATLYTIKIRAINANGDGDWFSDTFTTDTTVIPVVPQGVTSISSISTTTDTATINVAYSGSDTVTGYKYSLNDGASIVSANPIQLTGLASDTNYTIKVLAYNDVGDGGWSDVESIKTLRITTDDINTNNVQLHSDNKPLTSYVTETVYKGRDNIIRWTFKEQYDDGTTLPIDFVTKIKATKMVLHIDGSSIESGTGEIRYFDEGRVELKLGMIDDLTVNIDVPVTLDVYSNNSPNGKTIVHPTKAKASAIIRLR